MFLPRRLWGWSHAPGLLISSSLQTLHNPTHIHFTPLFGPRPRTCLLLGNQVNRPALLGMFLTTLPPWEQTRKYKEARGCGSLTDPRPFPVFHPAADGQPQAAPNQTAWWAEVGAWANKWGPSGPRRVVWRTFGSPGTHGATVCGQVGWGREKETLRPFPKVLLGGGMCRG